MYHNRIQIAGLWLKTNTVAARLILAGVLFLCHPANAANPLLWFNFDEGPGNGPATDFGTAPQTNGYLTGLASRTTDTPAGTGYALNLNTPQGDASSFLTVTNSKINTISNFLTVVTWLNLQTNTETTASDRLVDNGNGSAGFAWTLDNSLTTGTTNIRTKFFANTTGGAAFSSVGFNADHRWVFLAITYNATLPLSSSNQINYYIGSITSSVAQLGTPVQVASPGGPITNSTLNLRVGSAPVSSADRTPSAFFDGVRVYNSVLSLTDLEALRISDGGVPPPLQITSQPSAISVYAGSNATLSVGINLLTSVNYQWYVNGTNAGNAITGATNSALTLTSVTTNMNGNLYSCLVTNSYTNVWSSQAALTVVPLFNTGVLSNIWNILPGQRFYVTSIDGGERSLAYNALSNDVVVISHSATNSTASTNVAIAVLDAATGAEKYFMNISGITWSGGGATAVNMIGVADDGAVYGANISADPSSASTPFNIWRWADDGSNTVPVQAFGGDPFYYSLGPTATVRLGDNLAVRGAGNNTQILTCPASDASGYGTNALLLTTSDGINFSPNTIAISGVPSGYGQFGVSFGPGTNTFWAKTVNGALYLIQFDLTSLTGSVVYSYGVTNGMPNTLIYPGADTNQTWLAGIMNMSAGPGNIRLYNVSNLTNGPVLADQNLNLTQNPNGFLGAGMGTVAFGAGGNSLYTLAGNNGIRAFTINTNVALAPFSITGMVEAGGTLTLTWQSVNGHSYQIQSKAALTDATWSNVGGTVPASGSSTSSSVSTGGAMQFYRVQGN